MISLITLRIYRSNFSDVLFANLYRFNFSVVLEIGIRTCVCPMKEAIKSHLLNIVSSAMLRCIPITSVEILVPGGCGRKESCGNACICRGERDGSGNAANASRESASMGRDYRTNGL